MPIGGAGRGIPKLEVLVELMVGDSEGNIGVYSVMIGFRGDPETDA
jgi:hypothetical protein